MKAKKWLAALLGVVMTGSTLGVLQGTQVSAGNAKSMATEEIYCTDFEDGDVSHFSARGDSDTSVFTATQESDGNTYLKVTGRSKNWNGPQICLNDYCEPGEQYYISADVIAPWYASVSLSSQTTDADGNSSYANLSSAVSQGSWASIDAYKFNMPSTGTFYLYFECSELNEADGFYFGVDNVQITKAASASIQDDIAGLKDVYANYFKLGTAATTSEIAPKATQALIKKHFNSLTLGNELKPDSILDQSACQTMAANGDDTNPQVTLKNARTLLDFARDNNLSVRGHVLVWHQQTPDWFFREDYDTSKDFVSEEEMLVRLENYIKNVFAAVEEEYPTVDFYAWDVVNECWLDDGSYRTGGANSGSQSTSPWVAIFGDNSFIKYAFQYAKKYAPEGCKLYYNDYNEYMPSKTAAIINMVNEINADEQLIDGIGMQSHLDVSFPSISAYETALKKFCDTGLDIQITELDATVSNNDDSTFETQAQYYSDIMDLAVKYSDSISAVVFWGTTDDQSWRSSKYPLLFNEDYTAKPAYYSIVDGIDYTTPVTTTTEATTTTTTEATTTTTEEITTTTEEITTTTEAATTTEEITTTTEAATTTAEITTTTEAATTTAEITTTTEATTTTEPVSETTTSASNTDAPVDVMYGDINLDNEVNMSDLVMLNKIVSGAISGATAQQKANGDLNQDGSIDGTDAKYLLQFNVHILSALPVVTD